MVGVGQTLRNKYYLEAKIGSGAFGQTYKAKEIGFRSDVYCVVKHLVPDLSQVPQVKKPEVVQLAQELFEREINTLHKLGRYNDQIPTLLDNFEEKGEFFLVQEWIDGEPLSNRLRSGSPDSPGTKITQKETIAILQDILVPLKFCHQEGVVHRDLKPANIMERRSNGKLVLIDFGAVKDISQVTLFPPAQRLAVPGTRIGTPGFMPTEQYLGRPVYASDVYALGMLAIQALTGISPDELLADLSTNEVIWRDYCHVTDAFANIVTRMVRQLSTQRYQDAAEAIEALASLPYSSTTVINPLPSPPVNLPLPTVPTIPVNPPPIQPQPPPSNLTRHQKFSFEVAKAQIVKGLFGAKVNISKRTKQGECIIEDLGGGVKLEMVYIPAGSFMMGSPSGEKEEQNNEKPPHLVNVPAFYMGKYPVTQSQYLVVMGKNPSHFQGGNLPVENISWLEAREFCEKLSHSSSKAYRLPSEAEWEYACRAGTTTPFHFGETITADVANFDGNFTYGAAPKGKYLGKTTPVGQFGVANDFGLCDMHGNVWEWCLDNWHKDYNGAPVDGSAWLDAKENSSRALRGGSGIVSPRWCRSAYRLGITSDARSVNLGFRVVYSRARTL
jgi:eukaryotic-like serine/threonine-protein kinase